MNIKIIDGYVTVDGSIRVSATYKLFTKKGIDICMPKERQPATPDPWVNPNRVTTIGEANQTIGRLLESLAKRFDERGKGWTGHADNYKVGATFREMAQDLRSEKESLKMETPEKPIRQPLGELDNNIVTFGDMGRAAASLLEGLEKGFERAELYLPAAVCRAEKENWK
jgi:hypothetical protein